VIDLHFTNVMSAPLPLFQPNYKYC